MDPKLAAFLALLALVQGTPLQRSEIAPVATDKDNYRLPRSVVPSSYLIILHPNLETAQVEGYVEINVDVVQATRNITFHAKNITFKLTRVFNKTVEVKIANQTNDALRDFRVLHFASNLTPGQYSLKINYTNPLGTSSQRGFYRTSYVDNGVRRWLAATHFEATHARQAFPSFDEPALKANFTVHIRRNKTYNSISNMPLVRTIAAAAYDEDVFQPSVKMSTYLVAFAVSDFRNASRGNHRVFGQPKAIAAGNGLVPLEISQAVLNQLELYTKVKFSLPKIDQIELPEFPAGAMENWGLVTYANNRLLHNRTTDTVSHMQSVFSIIAHEYVHQWFGDLVGPDWWNYLWLNEGFARLYQYLIGDKVKPDWRLGDQFVTSSMHGVLITDSQQNTRPMTQDAFSPSEIRALFDKISYDKAACVIRTLQNAISDEVFRDGLNRYLLDRQYKAAVSADLWGNIQKAVDQAKLNLSIPTIMSTWEHQKGYPLVTVTRDYSTGVVQLTQQHFVQSDTPSKSLWYIPFNYATTKNTNFADTKATDWLVPNVSKVFNVPPTDWILVNKKQTGYYRVNYDEKNWNLLADYLNSTNYDKIHPISRAQLINDAFTLASLKRLNYGIALQFTKYLLRESDYIPLSALFTAITSFNSLASGTANYTLFERHLGDSLDKAVNLLGAAEKPNANEDKEHLNNLNRVNVFRWACEYENRNCWAKATAAIANVKQVSPTLQNTIFCAGLRGAAQNVWSRIYNQSITDPNADLKTKLNSALGCSQNAAILTSYVQGALAKNQSVFENIYDKGNFGVRFVFDYLLRNFEAVYKQLGTKTSSTITGIASHLNSNEQLQKLTALQTANKHNDLDAAFKSAVATVKKNVDSASPFLKDINDWIVKTLGKRY